VFHGKDFAHTQRGEEILKFVAMDIAVEISNNQEAVSSRAPILAGRL